MKNNKGITLVALVITIIVLIILAGISINLILGDNGIITIAKKAKENTELAKIQEETELNELYTQLEFNGTGSGGTTYDAIAKLTEFKAAIANAIDEAGGIKPEVSAETAIFANNIKGIVKEVTKSATATAEDILSGKTAWVNGSEIVGIGKNSGYDLLVSDKNVDKTSLTSTIPEGVTEGIIVGIISDGYTFKSIPTITGNGIATSETIFERNQTGGAGVMLGIKVLKCTFNPNETITTTGIPLDDPTSRSIVNLVFGK